VIPGDFHFFSEDSTSYYSSKHFHWSNEVLSHVVNSFVGAFLQTHFGTAKYSATATSCTCVPTNKSFSFCIKQQQTIAWINEFHYDDSGGDTGNFAEIAYTGGSINGYFVYFYNGEHGLWENGLPIYSTSYAPPGISYRFVPGGFSISISNGPGGIALIDPNNAVVEFISYEGSFKALNGPAAGQTSVDIGVQETGSTPAGYSLQKCPDVVNKWTEPRPNTKGQGNANCLTNAPSRSPSRAPSTHPSVSPTDTPSKHPTTMPSITPTASPSQAPTEDCTITWNLYNSATNAFAAALTNGTTIANPPPCGKRNIEAVIPCGASDDPVMIELFQGSKRVKNRKDDQVPYFLFGNNGANVLEGQIKAGRYGIRAIVDGVTSPFTNFTLGGSCS
jgi:hypothetical protein